jgi:hypothetical protein
MVFPRGPKVSVPKDILLQQRSSGADLNQGAFEMEFVMNLAASASIRPCINGRLKHPSAWIKLTCVTATAYSRHREQQF